MTRKQSKPKRPVIYISGPIDKNNIEESMLRFKVAEDSVKRAVAKLRGEVINPFSLFSKKASIVENGKINQAYSINGFGLLAQCTHIFMLKKWRNCPIAVAEYEFAKKYGIIVIDNETAELTDQNSDESITMFDLLILMTEMISMHLQNTQELMNANTKTQFRHLYAKNYNIAIKALEEILKMNAQYNTAESKTYNARRADILYYINMAFANVFGDEVSVAEKVYNYLQRFKPRNFLKRLTERAKERADY